MIAILDSTRTVVQVFNPDPTDPTQSLVTWQAWAAVLNPPCAAVECGDDVTVGQVLK